MVEITIRHLRKAIRQAKEELDKQVQRIDQGEDLQAVCMETTHALTKTQAIVTMFVVQEETTP